MFANAKTPSGLCSVSRFWRPSCGITLDTNDELLLTMLFFGFRLLDGSLLSLPTMGAIAGLPSPKVCADVAVPLLRRAEPFSLWTSSCILGGTADFVLAAVAIRNRVCGGGLRGAKVVSDSLVPAVGGPIVVASGLTLGVGLSEGWGGGVAKCSSSRRRYVPVVGCQAMVKRNGLWMDEGTFSHYQLVLGSFVVG